jgi:hypothetical protein
LIRAISALQRGLRIRSDARATPRREWKRTTTVGREAT